MSTNIAQYSNTTSLDVIGYIALVFVLVVAFFTIMPLMAIVFDKYTDWIDRKFKGRS